MKSKKLRILLAVALLLLFPVHAFAQEGEGGDEVQLLYLKAKLNPPEGVDCPARGIVWARQRGEDIRIVVGVARLEPGATYQVSVTPSEGDQTIQLGTLTTREGRRWRPGGNGVLLLSTRRGDEVPVADLEGLVGAEVKVYGPVAEEEPVGQEGQEDGGGEAAEPSVVLTGVLEVVQISHPHEPEPILKSVTKMTPPDGEEPSRTRGFLTILKRGDRESLTLIAARLKPGTEYNLVALISTDDGQETITLGAFTTTERVFFCPGGFGFLALRQTPEGLTSLLDLIGTVVEVRDAEGNVALQGQVAEAREIQIRWRGWCRHWWWHRRRHRGEGEAPPEAGEGGENEPAGGEGDGSAGGEEEQEVLKALALPVSVDFPVSEPHDTVFVRGDVNEDGIFNVADPIALLGYLFGGRKAPYCLDSGDANDDGAVDLSDATRMLMSLFGDGGPLPPPFAVAGSDPTPDANFCRSK